MKQIVIFSGTSEGRQISEYLSKEGKTHIVCVATEYGEFVMNASPFAEIHTGRMELDQMESFLLENASIVADATHPYATKVTENIEAAAKKARIPYLRIVRDQEEYAREEVTYCEGIEECSALLQERSIKDSILLTTGSKDLQRLTAGLTKQQLHHIYARVLPNEDSIGLCLSAGLDETQIIALQGPFSEERNLEHIKTCKAKALVTKESGSAGGFLEKYRAAKAAGIELIVIGRPKREYGCSVEEACVILEQN